MTWGMSAGETSEPDRPARRRFARFVRALGNRLFTGILFAIPLIVTYWVLSFGYGLVTGLSDPWLEAFGVDFPGAGFIITILASQSLLLRLLLLLLVFSSLVTVSVVWPVVDMCPSQVASLQGPEQVVS